MIKLQLKVNDYFQKQHNTTRFRSVTQLNDQHPFIIRTDEL